VSHDPVAMKVGFFGKIPLRGDFVQARLSRRFVHAWDDWLQAVLPAAAREFDDWEVAWQSAPAWRFRLPAGQCGPEPVVGVWMPSMDRAGRRFPLVIAAENAEADMAFLDAADAVGHMAIGAGLTPEMLMAALDEIVRPASGQSTDQVSGARWWCGTGSLVLDALPGAKDFARMVRP